VTILDRIHLGWGSDKSYTIMNRRRNNYEMELVDIWCCIKIHPFIHV